jgi:ubiquinol-cytochrome c reductase cytochrome b subunit
MGLAIGYGVLLSVPLIGANLAAVIWGGPFPGSTDFWPRMYITHVLFLPVLIATLIGIHLVLVASRHHTQFVGPKRTQRKVVGVPTFPGQAPRSLGLMLAVAAVVFLLGGLVQINPVWQWGPYHVSDATNGAQPDWYLGWLIGALRLVPAFDVTIGHYTLIPNAFWGGVLFPGIVFGFLLFWPAIERRVRHDDGFHNLIDRPRDAPWRTAIGAAMLTWVFVVFLAGSADRVFVSFGLSYRIQLEVYRVLVWVLPILVLLLVRRLCLELQAAERMPPPGPEVAAKRLRELRSRGS